MKKIAILIKESSYSESQVKEAYLDFLEEHVSLDDVTVVKLPYQASGKAPTAYIRAWVKENQELLNSFSYLYITDAAYFKIITGERKATDFLGLPVYKNKQVFTYGINYKQLLYNPDLVNKLTDSISNFIKIIQGSFKQTDIIYNASYPESREDIGYVLTQLLDYPLLTCDIETIPNKDTENGALYPHRNNIITIAFGINQHEGVAFKYNKELLKDFFINYKHTLIFHNATFDIKNLIYHLFMEHDEDWKGLIHGLENFNQIEDTKLIAYSLLNSTVRPELGLKSLAFEFAGAYGQENISDARKIPMDDLLEYNLRDVLATFYLFNKYKHDVEDVYHHTLLPSVSLLVHTELSGLPLLMDKVAEANKELSAIRDKASNFLVQHDAVKQALQIIRTRKLNDINSKLKVKQHDWSKVENIPFNFRSGDDLAILLFEVLKLPILSTTPTGSPKTGGEDIAELMKYADDITQEVLEHLISYMSVVNIISTFISALKNSTKLDNGHNVLHGSFVLGGTISGRLSSKSPNLQNIPARGSIGKIIKKCFGGKPGELFVGADFNGLEDRINTLLTKDPNKVKVFTQGYDGHSLRAYAYFGDKMPDINMVEAGTKCFKLGEHYLSENDVVMHKGKEILLGELI